MFYTQEESAVLGGFLSSYLNRDSASDHVRDAFARFQVGLERGCLQKSELQWAEQMLLALKRALSAVGMEFYADAAPDKAAKSTGDSSAQRRKEQPEKPQRTPAAQQRREREERPKKLTEPLPFTEWRKIQKGGKWGFYDGFKTVIPAMYDEVFFFKDGLAAAELDEKCGYINPENEVVIPFDYETAMSFSEGYASVVKGGKCGYINKDNEVVIPFVYDAATPFEGGEAKVKKDGRWGTILPDGSVKWI